MYWATLLALAVLTGKALGADVPSCSEQLGCLTFQENNCVGTSRTVCLGSNPSAAGCGLDATLSETINSMCSVVSGTGTNVILNGVGQTCGVFAGGSTATFSVSDGTSSGTATGNVLLVGSATASQTGTCTSQQTQLCAGGIGTNTLWTFAVTSCTCNCQNWTNWGTCGANCMRTRTRTCTAPAGVSCATSETESEACTGGTCLGCSCSADFTQWSSCSSTCTGGTSTRTRSCTAVTTGTTCNDITESRTCGSGACVDNTVFRCHCGGWTGWAHCSNDCGSGVQTRNRTCTPIAGGTPPASCPINFFPTSATQACTGSSGCATTTLPVGIPCTCGPWINSGGCVGTCGTTGVQTRARTCSSTCPASVARISTISCIPCIVNPGCTCGPWVNSGGCQGTCGTSGQQHQTRTCSGICPNVPTSSTVSCTPSCTAPTTSSNQCKCGSWVDGRCSVTCGRGSFIRTRICSGPCPASELITQQLPCGDVNSCRGVVVGRRRGRRRGRGRGRLGRRRQRRQRRGCRRFRTRAARKACKKARSG